MITGLHPDLRDPRIGATLSGLEYVCGPPFQRGVVHPLVHSFSQDFTDKLGGRAVVDNRISLKEPWG